MSDSEFFSTVSETDTEFEEALDLVEMEKQRDEESEFLLERMRECNISMSRVDGKTINDWLKADVNLDDVIVCGRLKRRNSTVLSGFISEERVQQLRQLAKEIIHFYEGGTQFKSYIDSVTACIIQFEYNL